MNQPYGSCNVGTLCPAPVGIALPEALRSEMEAIFGVSLAAIRLHQMLLPKGMTGCAGGDHIFLSPEYADLCSPLSRQVVAHELTHVLQQRRGEVTGRGLVIDATLEAEAEAVAFCVGTCASPPENLLRQAKRVLERLARPPLAPAATGVLQPRIIIENGEGAGIYDTNRTAALFDMVALVINGPYKGRTVTVRDEPVMNYLRSKDYYRFSSFDGLAQYMVQACLNVRKEVVYTDVPAPDANKPALKLVYGGKHGRLHFGGPPTKEKSKWSLSESDACSVMEAEIEKHIDRILRETPLNGVAGLWYIAGQYKNCGRYKDSTREGGLTDTFAIQAQVFIFQNEVHYHGYPDEQIRNLGCGMTRNGVNDNDEVDLERRGGRRMGASVQSDLEYLAELLGKK